MGYGSGAGPSPNPHSEHSVHAHEISAGSGALVCDRSHEIGMEEFCPAQLVWKDLLIMPTRGGQEANRCVSACESPAFGALEVVARSLEGLNSPQPFRDLGTCCI